MDKERFYAHARTDLTGPLHGLRVLDVSRVWSGPLTCGVLADLGADVLRVELPGSRDGDVPPHIPGTGLSWFRESVNRNKRSVHVDLRAEPGRFLDLVRDADIVVENFLARNDGRVGVGYEQCRQIKPDIIFVSITGWGQYGVDIDRPAYDPAVQAASGWMALNGDRRAPTFVADEFAGLHATIGALAALAHRQRTGEGQHVDVSMLDAMLASSNGLLTLAAAGAAPQPWGNETEFVVPCNAYRCRDGVVYLAIALNRQWRALAELAGRPELARAAAFGTAGARLENREAANELVADWCRTLSVDEVVASCHAAGVVAERVRSLTEVAADPHVRARDMVVDTALHNGSVAPLTGTAVKFSRTPTRIRHGAPAPGADSAEVFANP